MMKLVALLLCGFAAWGATPLNGTWRLNREKSKVEGALPSFVHDETMSFRPGGPASPVVPPANFVAADGNSGRLYRVDVSSDQRTLTVIRIQSYEDQSGKQFRTRLILEKQ